MSLRISVGQESGWREQRTILGLGWLCSELPHALRARRIVRLARPFDEGHADRGPLQNLSIAGIRTPLPRLDRVLLAFERQPCWWRSSI